MAAPDVSVLMALFCLQILLFSLRVGTRGRLIMHRLPWRNTSARKGNGLLIPSYERESLFRLTNKLMLPTHVKALGSIISRSSWFENNQRNACDSNWGRRNFRTASNGEDSTGELGSNAKVFGKQQLAAAAQRQASSCVHAIRSASAVNSRDDPPANAWTGRGVQQPMDPFWDQPGTICLLDLYEGPGKSLLGCQQHIIVILQFCTSYYSEEEQRGQ